jgi:hypothetical protein
LFSNSHSQQIGTRSQRSTQSPVGADEQGSQGQVGGRKSVVDLLQERITAFISKPAVEGQPNYAAEFAHIQIESDMVNTFFDEVHKLSDGFIFNFIESLKQDLETLSNLILSYSSEAATLFTLLQVMLRRLSPVEGAFANTLLLCKQIVSRINNQDQV